MVIKNPWILFIRKEKLIPRFWWNLHLDIPELHFFWCLILSSQSNFNFFNALAVLNYCIKLAYASNTYLLFHVFHKWVKCHKWKIMGSHLRACKKVWFQNFTVRSSYIFGKIIWYMKNPNSCNSKPYSACIAQKGRPKYNLYIFKKVFMLLLKCELAYPSPAFSQGIFIGFNEIAHANSEDVTKEIMHIDTCGLFKNNNSKKRPQSQKPCAPLPFRAPFLKVFRVLAHSGQTWVKLLFQAPCQSQTLQWAWNLPEVVFQMGCNADLWA